MATELAKAYVQIVPSARGIQGSISGLMSGEVSSAGVSAGRSFGEKMVGALKGVLATAAIGKALASTISEGAALEQSIGGVETLFKDSADTVKQYAAEAYRTAGVSANSYMEQVTSFSATLLQGLGGDTRAAAEYANQALVQMSDNANKFGTDIASIQYAYQGFAKDNYEMLDNLKLGYGGTQAEMARLINDSGVLGDAIQVTDETVKDVPFDKIIEAIGVIQDNLGITGTTAKEAATTLSGSLASMKAAFSNVLGGLALGQDIGPALNGLAETTTVFLADNLLPAVGNILSALPGAVGTFLSQMAPRIRQELPGLISSLSQALPAMAEQLAAMLPQLLNSLMSWGEQLLPLGIGLIQKLGQGLAQGIPLLAAQALPTLAALVSGFRSNFGQIVDAGIGLITNLAQGLIAALPTLITYVPGIVTDIAGLINDNAPKLLLAAANLIGMLAQGLVENIPVILANLPQIIGAIFNTIMAFNWLNLGAGVIRAIGNGLKSMSGTLAGVMEGTWKQVLEFLKSLPGKALQWGKDMIKGFVDGILGSVGGVVDAVKNVASATASYLHFSRPDTGPLRDYEQWMPDFMAGMAKGIEANAYRVRQAVEGLAGQLADPLGARMRFALEDNRRQDSLALAGGQRQAALSQDIRIQVYGAPGQDVNELARILMERIQQETDRRGAIFA